jgi:ATP-binding cassette subfamily B protein
MKKLLSYIRPFVLRMAGGFTIKFMGAIMDLLLPWMLSAVIDDVIPTGNVKRILLWGGGMILCSGLVYAFNVIPNRMAAHVARDITENLRMDLYEKTSSLSCAQVDRITIPSLISRITTDSYNVHRMLNMMQRLGVRAPILLVGGIIVTMAMEPRLGAVLLAMLPLMGLTIWAISRKGIPMYTVTQQKVDRMVQTVRENIVGIRIIKALSKEDYERDRFERVNEELSDQEKRAGVMMAATNPLMNLFLNTGLVLVLLLGAYLVYTGVSQIGKIIAFQSYFTIILNAMISISRMFVILSKGTASADRISEILDLPRELQPELGAREETADPEEFIAFDHVCFSYLGQKDNLSDISFTLKKGETLGIIGATGSGKSTIVNLLMRMYDVTGGQVRIGGVDVRHIPEEELHRMFGVVFQSDTLFADTIGENIAFGRRLTTEQIEDAARQAQAEEFILSREERFAEQLAIRGSNLSGGQRQRLLIARALAGQPPILVLDDSSSALDYKTDASLRQAIRSELTDTTCVIIAQRISSVMQADHILVLENGRAIGYGTHGQLMESCETYREIAGSQLGDGKLHTPGEEDCA